MTDDLFDVRGKRIAITGGTSGIGKMMVEGLARRGARVFTASRKQALLYFMSTAGGYTTGTVLPVDRGQLL